MFYCIVNPSARSGKGSQIWKKLEKKFKDSNIEYKAVLTTSPGHATKLARSITSTGPGDCQSPVKIVVLGGDGTLNEVINGIVDFENTLVGFIPIGSGNDFARDLDYPKDIDHLINTIVEGRNVRNLDLGKLTLNSISRPQSLPEDVFVPKVRMFDVSAGVGFDAGVCEEASHSDTKSFLNKIGLGKLTYGSIAIRQLLGAKKVPCSISFDDGSNLELKHFLLIASMIHHYEGGGFKFAPNADLSDGFFDLCIAGEISKPMMCIALPFSYFGKHYGFKGIYYHKAQKITIRSESPLWVHTDGEVSVKSDNITMECLKQKLRLMN